MRTAITKRVDALERRDGPDVIAFRWHDSDVISVNGVQMPLSEYERLYPDAITIHLTWGDDDAHPR